MGITYGSVCSGIEAATTAWHHLGWSPRWFAEIEPFPSAVLAHHWLGVLNLGDFTKIRDRIESGEIEAPDVLVGGTPCQAFSVAGLRKSLDDHRGQLSLEFVRLADAIDHVRSLRGRGPCVVVWENVPGVLSTPDNAFGCFLGALAGAEDEIFPGDRPDHGKSSRVWRWDRKAGKHFPVWPVRGVVSGPARTLAWRVLDAQWFGVAQRRRRVFVVASAGDLCPEQVLFEFDGVRRDSAPSRESGQGFARVAGTLAANGGGLNRPAGNANELDFCVSVNGSHWDGGPHPSLNQSNNIGGVGMSNQELFSQRGAYLAPCLQAGGKAAGSATQQDAENGALVVGFNARQDPDSWEDRTGPLDTDGGTQAVCVTGDVFHTLRAEGCDASEDGTGRGAWAVAVAFSSKDYGSDATDGIAPTMRSMGHSESHANGGGQLAVALALRGREGGATAEVGDDAAFTLRACTGGGDKPHALIGMQVRRLTPTECERLQGFPDGHTRIPWPVSRDLGQTQCLKQIVRATVRTPSGANFVSTNHIARIPDGGCPRAGMPTGQGYDLCRSVCGQEGHAEVNALRLAGKKARGSTLYLEGHTYVCEECLRAAEAAGIVEIVIGPPPTDDCPDGPRYKAIGNSMAVPVMRWIGVRIARQLETA